MSIVSFIFFFSFQCWVSNPGPMHTNQTYANYILYATELQPLALEIFIFLCFFSFFHVCLCVSDSWFWVVTQIVSLGSRCLHPLNSLASPIVVDVFVLFFPNIKCWTWSRTLAVRYNPSPLFHFWFWDRVLPSCRGWSWTYSVAKTGLGIFLPQLPE